MVGAGQHDGHKACVCMCVRVCEVQRQPATDEQAGRRLLRCSVSVCLSKWLGVSCPLQWSLIGTCSVDATGLLYPL